MKQVTTHYTFAADAAEAERKHREGKSWPTIRVASDIYSHPVTATRLFAIRTIRKALCPGWYVWTKGPIPVGARVGFDGHPMEGAAEPEHLQLWCSSALRNDFVPLTWEGARDLAWPRSRKMVFPVVYLDAKLLKQSNLETSAIKVVELK